MLLREAERGWKRSVLSHSADERWKGPDGDLLQMEKAKSQHIVQLTVQVLVRTWNLNVKWVAHSDCVENSFVYFLGFNLWLLSGEK